jgi:hypothetical protein
MLWPDPAQKARLTEIRDNLTARIAEAEREGWLGEMEGLKISLAGAQDKLTQIARRPASTADLGIPSTRRLQIPIKTTKGIIRQVQRIGRDEHGVVRDWAIPEVPGDLAANWGYLIGGAVKGSRVYSRRRCRAHSDSPSLGTYGLRGVIALLGRG